MTFLVFFYRWRGSVSFSKPLYIRFTDQLKPSEIMKSSTENFDPQKFKLLRGCLFTPEWYSNIVIYCITYVILRYKKRLKMALNFATNFRETLILVSKFLIYRRNLIWLKTLFQWIHRVYHIKSIALFIYSTRVPIKWNPQNRNIRFFQRVSCHNV